MSIVLALPGFECIARHLPTEQTRETQDCRFGLARHHRHAARQGCTLDPALLLASFHGSTGLTPGGRAIRARPEVIDRGRKEGMVRA
ncbi:hypothetical protein [uncultured Sphingomonas sp.]|uniref:hypothetical protein n=1 Tax=uncultured Sphingomonas sp. TaxID=158754 RepID=UPI0030DD571F